MGIIWHMSAVIVRLATLADARDLAVTVQEGFETYRAWAPRGWDPPSLEVHVSGIRDRLPEPGCVCLLAEVETETETGAEREPAGHVAYLPARDEVAVAHVWMLFVRRQQWGTGIATDLLARAVAAATEEGYTGMRLHTPAGHARARAFYEREGWTAASPPFYEPMLGLPLVTYRIRL